MSSISFKVVYERVGGWISGPSFNVQTFVENFPFPLRGI